MLLILPIAAFVFVFLCLRERNVDWRTSALAAPTICATFLVAITELLSLPRLITREGVAISWLAVSIGAFLYWRRARRERSVRAPDVGPKTEGLDRTAKILLAAVAVIVLLVGITAVISAPNIWDAMEYHLPRVSMWMSNQNVRFFPTPNYAQLIFSPWAEYAAMHNYLLWGTDRFVNLLEFFSLVGCAIGVSLIAKKLGAGPWGQALAAIVCATIPEGVLEASGPMNTYVASFWIMTTVAFVMIWNDDPSWLNTILIGSAAGIAILTKGTAFVYLPFLVLAAWWMGSSSSRVRFLKRSAVFVVLILAINGPQFFRSYQLTGSPLGLPFPDAGPGLRWKVDRVSVRGTLANMIRNASLHISTPSQGLNERIEKSLRTVIRGIGADPDDPATTWPGDQFHVWNFSLNEMHAGNPLHLALLLLSIGVVLVWSARKGRPREPLLYALGLIGAFILFCALLRWQPWDGRHHLPLFVLGAALTGFVLERFFSRKVAAVAGIALVAYAMPFVISNRTRSLVRWSMVDDVYHPRSVLYFTDQHEALADVNIAAADAVNRLDCRNVAIDSYLSQPESQINHSPKSFFVYPLLALIHADGRARKVWYSGVDNWSSRYAEQEPHPAPCAVICLECANVPSKWKMYKDVGGRASVFGYIVVFSAAGNLPNGDAVAKNTSAPGKEP